MPQGRELQGSPAEMLLEPRATGTRAVYIVETRNRHEVRELHEMFASLDGDVEVRQLAEGTVTSYAVRVEDRDLPLLAEIELALKENYRFSIAERSFEKGLYAVVRDLCADSGSLLRKVAECGICEAPEPFPTTVEFLDAAGRSLGMGCYCARCAAATGAANDRDLAQRLVAADRTGLATFRRLRLKEQTRQTHAGTEFEVDGGDLRLAATG